MKSILVFAAILFGGCVLPEMAAAAPKSEALYDISLDMDGDGKMDRAVLVLVGPGRTDFGEMTKDRYGLETGERVDLYVYLGEGDAKPDISRQPSFRNENIIDAERTNWVQPLESRGKGALLVTSVYGWGASKSMEDGLTIIYRGGKFLVAGYTLDWEWGTAVSTPVFDVKTSDGTCDINLLSGRGDVSFDGDAKKSLKGRFKTMKLADWSEKTRPKICDSMMSLAIARSIKE
jgi:hypothetical protein